MFANMDVILTRVILFIFIPSLLVQLCDFLQLANTTPTVTCLFWRRFPPLTDLHILPRQSFPPRASPCIYWQDNTPNWPPVKLDLAPSNEIWYDKVCMAFSLSAGVDGHWTEDARKASL